MKRFWASILAALLALGPGLSPALANKPTRGTPGKPTPTPILTPAVNGGMRVPGQTPIPGTGLADIPKLPASAIVGTKPPVPPVTQSAAFKGVEPARFPAAPAAKAAPKEVVAVTGALPQLKAAPGASGASGAAPSSEAAPDSLEKTGEAAKALFDGAALSENGNLPDYNAPVYFTEEFKASVEALEKRQGKERWSPQHWDHLKSEVNNYLAGGPTTAVQAKRGPALEADVWKFKWGVHRIFFHPAADRLSLVLLEAKAKGDLLKTGEEAYYQEMAARVRELKENPAAALVTPKRHESLIARLGKRLAAGGLEAASGTALPPAPAAPALDDTAETLRYLETPLAGSYEAPRPLLGARAFYRHLSWASWTAAGTALVAALGAPLALLTGAAMGAGTIASLWIGRDIPVERPILPRVRQERLLRRAGDILGTLLVREGQGRGVGLSLARFKTARGAMMGSDGKSFHMLIDERWEDAPASQLAGVMAHEIGHTLPENAPVFPGTRAQAARLEWMGVAVIALATTLKLFVPWLGGELSGVDFSHLSAGQQGTLYFAGLAALLWAAGLALAMAAMRHVELVCDHFSGWLTRPAWLAAFLRELAARRSLKFRLLRPFDYRHGHPTDAERVRRLER